jgi:hypothetical protein
MALQLERLWNDGKRPLLVSLPDSTAQILTDFLLFIPPGDCFLENYRAQVSRNVCSTYPHSHRPI